MEQLRRAQLRGDHPRVSGEHREQEAAAERDKGSSPRERGAPDRRNDQRLPLGIIPA